MNKLKIIKDLGLIETNIIRNDTGKNRKLRFYIVECTKCNKQYKISKKGYDANKTGLCNRCSSKVLETHSMSNSRLYCIWQKMKDRCFNEKHKGYSQYGSKGISICKEWLDFNNFKEWSLSNFYNDDKTIDRIDNTKGYCKDNCRWVDFSTQASNKNKSKGCILYIGISKGKRKNSFIARLYFNGKCYLRKTFNSIEEALEERNKVILENNLPHKIQKVQNGTY